MDNHSFQTKLAGICLILILLGTGQTQAQQYDRSAGIRLSGSSGLTFKKFVVDEQAFEIIISGRKEGIQLTGLYMMHEAMNISFNDNFFFYYGVGGHLGVEKHDDIDKRFIGMDPPFYQYEEKSYITMGIDGIMGIEYRMLSVPITLSLDFKPYINYVGLRKVKADFWDASIAVKYVF